MGKQLAEQNQSTYERIATLSRTVASVERQNDEILKHFTQVCLRSGYRFGTVFFFLSFLVSALLASFADEETYLLRLLRRRTNATNRASPPSEKSTTTRPSPRYRMSSSRSSDRLSLLRPKCRVRRPPGFLVASRPPLSQPCCVTLFCGGGGGFSICQSSHIVMLFFTKLSVYLKCRKKAGSSGPAVAQTLRSSDTRGLEMDQEGAGYGADGCASTWPYKVIARERAKKRQGWAVSDGGVIHQ
jgi:hypothetical protein